MTFSRIFVQLAAAIAVCWPATVASAAERTNLIVMTDDSDRGSLSRRSPVFGQVVNAVQNHLFDKGYRVFDAAVVFRGNRQVFRWRTDSAQLLELVRSAADYPLDILVILRIYGTGGSRLDDIGSGSGGVRVAGRLVEIRSGRVLGSFESQGRGTWGNCGRRCDAAYLGRHAAAVGRDVADALVFKLNNLGAPGEEKPWVRVPSGNGKDGRVAYKPCAATTSTHVIEFENFSRPEMRQIREDLASFRCYDRHRILRESGSIIAVWYESSAGSKRLADNLKFMLDYMGLYGRITPKGRTITVKRELPN